MDEVCQDYVNAGWLFVAVKAKVGQKEGVNPKPGMTDDDVESDRPDGSVFDGHVPGHGVPASRATIWCCPCLASYNAGEMHNVVHHPEDSPDRDSGHPAVIREAAGVRRRSVPELRLSPLPLRIYGGGYEDIPDWQRTSLATQRDRATATVLARELFAADLLAARMGELSLAFEEREKELLNISERLELRGEEIDRPHRQALKVNESTSQTPC